MRYECQIDFGFESSIELHCVIVGSLKSLWRFMRAARGHTQKSILKRWVSVNKSYMCQDYTGVSHDGPNVSFVKRHFLRNELPVCFFNSIEIFL